MNWFLAFILPTEINPVTAKALFQELLKILVVRFQLMGFIQSYTVF